jgi:transcriptional regulator with XRE-family HTH domain
VKQTRAWTLHPSEAAIARAWIDALLEVYGSRSALARDLGISAPALLHVQRGRNNPGWHTVSRLAEVVNLTEAQFLSASRAQIARLSKKVSPGALDEQLPVRPPPPFQTLRAARGGDEPTPGPEYGRALERVGDLFSAATLARARYLSRSIDGSLDRTEKEWVRLFVFAESLMMKR